MTKFVPKKPNFPVGIVSGVQIHEHVTEKTGEPRFWYGWVRKCLDHDSYIDQYVQAPTQTTMILLIKGLLGSKGF